MTKSLTNYIILMILTLTVSCLHPSPNTSSSPKITFDPSLLNDEGLYGPPGGLRSLDYEFCIPTKEVYVEQVRKIDRSLVVHKKAKGRIACSQQEYLCIGNTHQSNFREVLAQLAALDYIKKIDQTFYE